MQFRLKINSQDEDNQRKKSVKDIINFICEKWQLRRKFIELRLCRSAAEIVQ